MKTDADFLDRNKVATKTRRRVRLCFVALLACVAMMADLVADANAQLRAADQSEIIAPDTNLVPMIDVFDAAEDDAHL